jgi:hypothetical protein
MRKYIWIFFILNVSTKNLMAQPGKAAPIHDKWMLRFNALGLVDVFDGNISGGIAYTLSQRWLLSADLAYIFYSTYLPKTRFTSGYIFKPAVRYYLSDKKKFYIESTVWYKRSAYKIRDWLDKDCVNGVPTYQEFKTFRFRKQVVGLNIQGGIQKSLMRNNVLRMEIYTGIGIRYKWQGVINDPEACYQPENIFFTTLYGPHHFSASLPHGLRLVYMIR